MTEIANAMRARIDHPASEARADRPENRGGVVRFRLRHHEPAGLLDPAAHRKTTTSGTIASAKIPRKPSAPDARLWMIAESPAPTPYPAATSATAAARSRDPVSSPAITSARALVALEERAPEGEDRDEPPVAGAGRSDHGEGQSHGRHHQDHAPAPETVRTADEGEAAQAKPGG